MPFKDGMAMIEAAIIGRNNDRIYNRWVWGGYDKHMPLDEFKRKATNVAQTTIESADEILKKLSEKFKGV